MWNRAADMQQVWVLLTLMLTASQGDMHGEAGTSSGIVLRPGVLLHRNSRDIFVRAAGPVRLLLGELEEFCDTSLKTLLLLAMKPRPHYEAQTAAGAAVAREQEQPSLSSLQQGGSDSPSSLQSHCQNSLLLEEVITLP